MYLDNAFDFVGQHCESLGLPMLDLHNVHFSLCTGADNEEQLCKQRYIDDEKHGGMADRKLDVVSRTEVIRRFRGLRCEECVGCGNNDSDHEVYGMSNFDHRGLHDKQDSALLKLQTVCCH